MDDARERFEEAAHLIRRTQDHVPRLQRLTDLGVTPAAIIVRVTFEGIAPAHAACVPSEQLTQHRFSACNLMQDGTAFGRDAQGVFGDD